MKMISRTSSTSISGVTLMFGLASPSFFPPSASSTSGYCILFQAALLTGSFLLIGKQRSGGRRPDRQRPMLLSNRPELLTAAAGAAGLLLFGYQTDPVKAGIPDRIYNLDHRAVLHQPAALDVHDL